MKTKVLKFSVVLLASIVVLSCVGTPAISLPEVSVGTPWKFYFLGTRQSPTSPLCWGCIPKEGWHFIWIDLAAENTTDAPVWMPMGSFCAPEDPSKVCQGGRPTAELTDTEGVHWSGYSLGIEPYNTGRVDGVGGDFNKGLLFWPGFRTRFIFWSGIPNNVSPATLTLIIGPNSYTINLQHSSPGLKTPFETTPIWKAKLIGDSIEIPQDVRVTVKSVAVDRGTFKLVDRTLDSKVALAIDLQVENTGGSDLNLRTARDFISRAYAFNETGYMAQGDLSSTIPTLHPGGVTIVQAKLYFIDPMIDSFQYGWLVLCLSPYPKTTQATQADKCDIYEIKAR